MNARRMLISVSVLAWACAPAHASDTYYFRSKPSVSRPAQPFSFPMAAASVPGELAVSAATPLSGYAGRTATVSGGEFRICASLDCSGPLETWRSSAVGGLPDSFFAQVRTRAGDWSSTTSATLTVGAHSAAFEVPTRSRDSSPDLFAFLETAGATAGATVVSGAAPLASHDGVRVSVEGQGSPEFRLCTDASCATATQWSAVPLDASAARDGSVPHVQVRLSASPVGGERRTASLTAGEVSASWIVTTKPGPKPPSLTATYVPSNIAMVNAHMVQQVWDKGRVFDGELTLPAWAYSPGDSGADIVRYDFDSYRDLSKCYLVWENDTTRMASAFLHFSTGGDNNTKIPVTIVPGVNVYDGPCGLPRGDSLISMGMSNAAGTGKRIIEFRVGR